jgi:CHAT domain-containing protein/tetratricopeptide (TPR) repeat protein
MRLQLSVLVCAVVVAQRSGAVSIRAAHGQETIAPSAPVERDLSAGQTHTYQLAPGGEQCVRIAVDQRGIDVAVTVRDLGGQPLVEVNRLGPRGTELLAWASAGPGVYELVVSAPEATPGAGRYELLVAISPPDGPCKAAFETYATASRLLRDLRSGGGAPAANRTAAAIEARRREAAARFSEALELLQALGDRELAAVTLQQLAGLNAALKEVTTAVAQYEQARTLFRALNKPTEEALVLNSLGETLLNEGDYAGALEFLTAALPLADTLAPLGAAELAYNNGVAFQHLSRHDEAIDLFQRAREAFRRLGKRDYELQALSDIGRTHYANGGMIESLEYATEGLSLSRASGMPLLEARFAQDVARVYDYLGDLDQAREYCERALRVFRAERYANGEIATLLLLGDVDYSRSDNAAARASYERAATLAATIRFREAEERALVRLATVLSEQGEFPRAIEYTQRALAYYRATGNKRSEVSALLALGKTYRQMGAWRDAASTFQQALAISREAAAGFSETPLLGELAQVARDEGRLEDAERLLVEVLEKFDAERRSLLAPSLSATFLSGAQNWYDVYADLLMRLNVAQPQRGYDTRAWSAAERAKAWGLLEMLAESRSDVSRGVDRSLLDQRQRLWAEMTARAAASQRSPSGQAAGRTQTAIDDLAARLQVVEARIRAANPAYVDLIEPRAVTTSELQQQLLDSDTVLLEFALGDDESWVWAIAPDTFETYTLASRSKIDAAARRLYDLLTVRQSKTGPRQPQQDARIAEADAAMPAAAAELSRLLLAPIDSRLRREWRDKRLVVVASGSLEYVPFGILPLSTGRQLLQDHEVVNLPSATVLAALRRGAARRPPATRTLALIADPVFDASDSRVSRERSDTRGGFARLPFSREEAAAIAQLVPRPGSLHATDFKATHALAVGGELSHYRFVHFATHGLLNSRHPELSGLVLSLVDERGRPQNGFLRLKEIYDLQLAADVVVLSACQTALGKEIKGEGLVGLTRGFMYAGARRVVASLWQVDDLATAQLMKTFYQRMLKDGLRPAAALRSAQLEMMKQDRWAAPYYWAAFTMQGEWR